MSDQTALESRPRDESRSTSRSGVSFTARATSPAGHRDRVRRVWRVTANVTLAVIALGWFFLLRPTWLGGPATVVRVTGVSMEPGMHSGDLAIVHEQDAYDIGDVVAFQVLGQAPDTRPFVIHRIVAEEDGIYTLRGDNNDHDDPWQVRDEDIAGRLWADVPAAGAWMTRLMDPVVLAAVAAATTAFLVVSGPDGRRDSQ